MPQVELTLTLTPTLDAAKLNAMLSTLKASLGPLGDQIKPIDAEKLNAELRKVEAEAKTAAQEVDKISQAAKNAAGGAGLLNKAFQFNQITQAVNTVAQSFNQIVSVGNEYESTLAAVGAITGQTGEGLNKLGDGARELSLQFGGPAANNLKVFQGILSKFGPQVAENADALKLMGETVNTLSAASGDSADVSMAALTDTMLQLGLVSGDSAKDAQTMVEVADALAASAKVGAAEIPQVAQSILQTGVAAKSAKLGLSETTAAIQVLAVGGKTGSEAGVALRNVLGFLQKQSGPGAAALRDMGLSVEQLGETLTTQGLAPALELLKTGLNTAGSAAEKNAVMMTLFGTENAAAAGILLDNLSLFGDFQSGIANAVQSGAQGADGATAQATARLGTAEAIAARLKAQVEDVFISIQSTLGSGLSGILTAATQVAPAISAMSGLKNIIPSDTAASVLEWSKSIVAKLVPSLFTQVAATGGATTAQLSLNAAMLANPAGLVIAGIAGIIAVTAALSSILNETAQEQLEAQQAETAVLEEQKKSVETRYQQAQAASTAASEYKNLIATQQELTANAAEEGQSKEQQEARAKSLEATNESLRQKTLALAEAYPNLIDGTKSYEENLKALEAQSGANASEMIALAGEMNKLDQQLAESKTMELQLEVAVAGESLEDELTDALDKGFLEGIKGIADGDIAGFLDATLLAGFGGEISEAIFGTSFGRDGAEKLVGTFKNDIYGAKNADEIAKAQAQMISKIALDGEKLGISKEEQQKVIASVKAMGSARLKQLEQQKKAEENLNKETTESIVQAFTDATNAGKDTTGTVNELAKAFGLSAEKVRSLALDGVMKAAAEDGKITAEEIDNVANKFSLSKEEAKKLLEEQVKQTQEAKNTATSVKDISAAYQESFNELKKQREQGIADEIALDAKIRSLKRNDPERKKYEADLKALRANNRELDRNYDIEVTRQKQINATYEDKEKKQKSLFQQLKTQLDAQTEVLEKAAAEANLAIEEQAVAQERKKSIQDEIEQQKNSIKAIEAKIAAAKKVGLIDESGVVSIKITSDEDRNAAQKIINDLNIDLAKQQLKAKQLNLQVKFETIELQDAIRKDELDALRDKFKEGIIPSETLISELTIELEKIQRLYLSADEETKVKLAKQERSLLSEMADIRDKAYDRSLKKLREASQKEQEELKKSLDEAKLQAEALIDAATTATSASATLARDEAMKQLDKLRENEEISEGEYNTRREEAEKLFQGRLTTIKAREQGLRLALQNRLDAESLEAKRNALQKELTLAEQSGDTLAAEKLREELSEVETTLQEKTDTIGVVLGQISDGLQESMSSLFEGDTDAMKDSMRKTLALIAGFLSQLAEAAILELVLGSTPLKALAATFGFAAPLALAGFKQLISLGVRQVIDPILSGLGSFATGGVFTQPTLAMVGDASRLGGSNIEYLLRNDQLRAVISEALSQRESTLVAEIRRLRHEIAARETRFVAKGSDLQAVVERSRHRSSSRGKGLTKIS